MTDPDPDPDVDLPDDLAETLQGLSDHQLSAVNRYTRALLADRSDSIVEMIRETEDPDRIVSIEEEDEYVTVRRQDVDDGPPTLYHVRPVHHPDGAVDLDWMYLGRVVD